MKIEQGPEYFAMLRKLVFESEDFCGIVGITEHGKKMRGMYSALYERKQGGPGGIFYVLDWEEMLNPVAMVGFFNEVSRWQFAFAWACTAEEGIGEQLYTSPYDQESYDRWVDAEVVWLQRPNKESDTPDNWNYVDTDEDVARFRKAIDLALDLKPATAFEAYDLYEKTRLPAAKKFWDWQEKIVEAWREENRAVEIELAAKERRRAEDPEAATGNVDLVWLELPDDYAGVSYIGGVSACWHQSRAGVAAEHYVMARCPYCTWTPQLLRKSGWPHSCPNCLRNMFADPDVREQHNKALLDDQQRRNASYAAKLETQP